MLVPDKLKLNKFKQVHIPRPSQIVGRLGLHEMKDNSFTGDIDMPLMVSKLDNLCHGLNEIAKSFDEFRASQSE